MGDEGGGLSNYQARWLYTATASPGCSSEVYEGRIQGLGWIYKTGCLRRAVARDRGCRQLERERAGSSGGAPQSELSRVLGERGFDGCSRDRTDGDRH
jgi:hypothetical protein